MAARDKNADTVVLPVGDLSVTFRKPEPGQIAALRRAAVLFGSSDKATQGQGGLLFLEVLDDLVTDQAILNRLYSGMAKREIDLESYGDAAIELIKHFAPEEEKAPTTGPVSTRRARVKR